MRSSACWTRLTGPYGEDGKPPPAGEEGGLPFTDYEVQIESGLKSNDVVIEGGTMVPRMLGVFVVQPGAVLLLSSQIGGTVPRIHRVDCRITRAR